MIEDVKRQAQIEAHSSLGGETKRIVGENKRMAKELRFQMQVPVRPFPPGFGTWAEKLSYKDLTQLNGTSSRSSYSYGYTGIESSSVERVESQGHLLYSYTCHQYV